MVGDIDGFYGEPAEYDAALEVELMVVEQLPQVAQVIALEDAWFDFDDTKVIESAWDDEIPTTTWQRFGGWLRSIGRAA